jgi:NADH:ubiquinone oxidoreductase subunit 6 (subunit J)
MSNGILKLINIIIAILLFVVLFLAIDGNSNLAKDEVIPISVLEIAGGHNEKGEILHGGIFTDYIFSFELLSILLIAALIGALYIAKKEAF